MSPLKLQHDLLKLRQHLDRRLDKVGRREVIEIGLQVVEVLLAAATLWAVLGHGH